MTSIFNGMAGVLNATFGAPVTFIPAFGPRLTVQSVFREPPVTVAGQDGGDVLIEQPIWRVPRDRLAHAARGDQIQLADGRRFKILNRIGTGSPATDAFVEYELEAVL